MSELLAIVGPTASGKSRLAHALALELGASIISADSMQVYRGMDIGTAKPTRRERQEVDYHLIDVVDPAETFTVADYQRLARSVVEEAGARPIIVVGGSGLHFRALVDDLRFPPHNPGLRRTLEAMSDEERVADLLRLDPEAGRAMDLANPRRVIRALEVALLTGATPTTRARGSHRAHHEFSAVGLDAGDHTRSRIVARLESMMTAGFLDEVQRLGGRLARTAAQAVGYRELQRVLDGELKLPEAMDAIIRATVALARRQRTFFKRDPRISWIPWTEDQALRLTQAKAALRLLEQAAR